MIHVFCDKRGSGKTKTLINLANEKIENVKGTMVYIDDDRRPIFNLDSRIRFITTEDFKLNDYDEFYGFLCGILSEDYDIETIFIDGLSNIVSGNIKDAAHLFLKMERLSLEYKLDVYISLNGEAKEVPEFIKKYVA